MHSLPGQDCDCEKIYGDHNHEEDDENTCDNCGAELEWKLGLDGVQRRECPNCDS